MPGLYVGAAMAVEQGVQQAVGSDSPTNSGGAKASQSSSGGWAPLAGGIVSAANPPQAQTNPGSYSPPSNIGEGYNYIPTGQAAIDQLIQQLLQQSGSTAAGTSGLFTGGGSASAPNLSNMWTGGVGDAMNSLSQQGQGNVDIARLLQGAVPGALNSITSSAGFNPQQLAALYQDQLTKTQNQANVQNAQSGVGSSPFGVGAANDAVESFNTNWPLFLQSLQTGGINNLRGLGSYAQGAAQLGQAGAGQQAQSGTLPYETYNRLAAEALGLAQGQQGVTNSALTPALNYEAGARQSNALANTVAMGQAQMVGNQNANAAAGLSQGLSAIAPALGQGLSGLYKSIFPDDGTDGVGNTISGTDMTYAEGVGSGVYPAM